jgi:hypothetical protein
MTLQTYRIASPLDTHWRVGTCEEDHCDAYLRGWRTVVDENTELGQQQAAYIRGDRSRKHTETREVVELPPHAPDDPPVTGVPRTVFTFEAGQKCFRQHRVPLNRPELYLVDSNGSRRTHSGPDAWRDDLCTNQERLAELINRG